MKIYNFWSLQVVQEGIKDIYITSEDTGAYGRDINTNISMLMKEIIQVVPSDVMIRVYYYLI